MWRRGGQSLFVTRRVFKELGGYREDFCVMEEYDLIERAWKKYPYRVQKVEFTITGMTCTGCEHHVKSEVSKLGGIIEAVISYEKSNAIVKFDESKTSIEGITTANESACCD